MANSLNAFGPYLRANQTDFCIYQETSLRLHLQSDDMKAFSTMLPALEDVFVRLAFVSYKPVNLIFG